MTLLAPISAIVAGAIGGAILLLVHMLRLRRRPVRVSTIMFWGDPPKDLEANVPIRMIRPSWTLLLQAIAIALLALALGRPVIDAPAASTDRLYILIDTSASMSARDSANASGPTRLDRAKEQARRLIAGVGGLTGSRAMLVSFASRAQGVTSMTADRAALTTALDAIEPTDERGSLDSALDLVASLLLSQAAEGEYVGGSRVIVLSDGSFEGGVTRTLPGATLDFRAIGQPDAENLAIAAIAARRDDRDPAIIRVFVRLISTRHQPTPITLTLTIDGAELARRAVEVPPAPLTPAASPDATPNDPAITPSQSASSQLTPGEHALALEFRRIEGAVLRASFDRPDALDADNQAWLVLPESRRPAILLVSPDGRADLFVRGVLEEVGAAWLRIIDAPTFEAPLGQELASAADLIVFDRVRPRLAPDRPTLSIGAGIPSPGLDADSASDDGAATGALQWDRTHPALAGLSLDTLQVSRTVRLRPAPGTPMRILAMGRDTPLIAEGRDAGVRRIVVTFAASDSNWPLTPGFAIFLASAIDDLVDAGRGSAGQSWRAGETISAPDLDGQPIELQDADGRRVAVGSGSVLAPRAGLYTLRAASRSRPAAVNLGSEFESLLRVEPTLRIAGEALRSGQGGIQAQELWFWFVLAAGVVLLVEWGAYLWLARG